MLLYHKNISREFIKITLRRERNNNERSLENYSNYYFEVWLFKCCSFFPKFHPLISRCSKSHTLFFRLMFELQFFLCIQNSILSSFDLFIVNFSARHFYWNFYCDIIRFLISLTVCISITSFIRCKNESFWSSLFIGSLMSMRSSCCASASLIMSKLLKMLYKKLFCISLSSIIFV